MLTNVMTEPFCTIAAQYPPQFECSKPTSQRHVPVAIVDNLPGISCFISKIGRQDTQRIEQRFAISNPEHIAIEIRKQPLVRVEGVTVDVLECALVQTVFCTDHRITCPGRIHVMPHSVAPGQFSNRIDGIDCARARCSQSRYYKNRR